MTQLHLARISSAACLAALATALPQAHAVTLVNGSLESESGGTLQVVTAGASANGWGVSGNNIEFVRVGHTTNGDTISSAFDGQWFVDLNGNQGPGTIAQSMTTVAGQSYRVDFWISGNPGPNGVQSGGGPKTMELEWNGASVGSFSYVHQAGDDWGNLRWQAQAALVAGTGGLDTLGFRSTSTVYPAAGVFIDAVSISAVPEPASWALMLAGVAVLMRRRIHAASCSAAS